jgi:hypothetical protein
MRVLVACECSGIIRDAFKDYGHFAMLCDLKETSSPGEHYMGDVFNIIDQDWDLMIACPPCTYLSNAKPIKKAARLVDLRSLEAINFFLNLYGANIPMICVENPSGIMNSFFRKPDMVLNPFNFGEPERKRSCFWLKNLPPLILGPLANSAAREYTSSGIPKYFVSTGARSVHRGAGAPRSVFFKCIADAMAQQWNY